MATAESQFGCKGKVKSPKHEDINVECYGRGIDRNGEVLEQHSIYVCMYVYIC